MRPLTSIFLIVLMSWAGTGRAAAGDPALLDLRVIEGDGATYAPGSRATRGVAILVTDETGKPVEGATVSFMLPMDGPSGVFASGARTEIVRTKADGQAAVWGMRWNSVAGPFEIRVTALKGQARAGIALTQNLAGGVQSKSAKLPSKLPGGGIGGHKWLWIALVGAAGAGAAGFAGVKGSSASAGSASSPSTSAVQIGAPSITLGHP
jgi:hypothetical protein